MKENNITTKKLAKKIVISILVLITIIMQTVSFPTVSNANKDYKGLKLEVDNITSLNTGDIVTVKISTEGDPIQSIDAFFEYDLSIFEKVTAEDITVSKKNWDVDSITYDSDLYGENKAYIIIANGKAVSETGDIATIRLKLKQPIKRATVSLSDIFVVTEDFSSIGPLDIISTEIKIESTLTVNPNGGVWEGSSNIQTFKQAEETTKEISIPTSTPTGNIIQLNSNGGEVSTTELKQTTKFNGWTGATLTGNTYTFEATDKTITANYVGNSVTLPKATKIGTRFLGWYDSEDNFVGTEGDTYTPEFTTPNATITLTAKYEEERYTLTIDPNGGTYTGNVTVEGTSGTTVTVNQPTKTGYKITLDNNDGSGNTSVLTQTHKFDKWTCTSGTINENTYIFGTEDATITANYIEEAIELPTLVREGYTFLGWFENKEGGSSIKNPYMPTSDKTLYARWTPNIYTITFEAGTNATVDTRSKQVIYGQEYGTLPIPTRPGYTFKNWKLDGKEINETDIVNITSDKTLTAEWENSKIIVTFNPNGGQIDINNKEVTVRSRYGTLPIAEKSGYKFIGWYDDNHNQIQASSIVKITENHTLTAEWEPEKYTITFVAGENANIEEQTREVIYGQEYGTLPTPKKPGYTYTGWYDENGNKINENDIIDRMENITLTAKWEPNEYTLTFDYDGGTGDITNKTIKNEEPYGELPEVNKEGYDFIGWYDQNGNKIESTDIVDITSDITLKAKFETKKYFITFKNDDGTEIKTIKVEHGTEATFTGDLPEKPGVADGYKATFTGWDNEEALQNVTEDLTLTARYEVSPIVYTITYYNLKEADNSSNKTTYTIEDENFDIEGLENQGKYLFIGWFTSNEENAEEVTSIDTSKLGNIVLYARWYNDELYLSSKKYKVGENNIDNYEDGDIYLDKIEPETTVSELIDNCDTNGIITVIDKDGNVLEEDDLVGTGMTIKVTKDDEEINLTAIVMGDLNGDGKVTATDLSTLNQTIIYRKTLEEVRFKAVDLDDNTKLTATDLSTINQTILDIIELTYSKEPTTGLTSL